MAFQRRWEAVQAAEKVELAATPIAHKFRQLEVLLATAKELGWDQAAEEQEDLVRERWAKIRRVLHV